MNWQKKVFDYAPEIWKINELLMNEIENSQTIMNTNFRYLVYSSLIIVITYTIFQKLMKYSWPRFSNVHSY